PVLRLAVATHEPPTRPRRRGGTPPTAGRLPLRRGHRDRRGRRAQLRPLPPERVPTAGGGAGATAAGVRRTAGTASAVPGRGRGRHRRSAARGRGPVRRRRELVGAV